MRDTIHVRPTKAVGGRPTGEWHWTRQAANGKAVAGNGGFNTVESARDAAEREKGLDDEIELVVHSVDEDAGQ